MCEKTLKAIQSIKQLVGLHILIPNVDLRRKKNKNAWKKYIVSTKRKKENVSSNIDKILYNHS